MRDTLTNSVFRQEVSTLIWSPMRDYALWVPHDAVAAEIDGRGRFALDMMRETMGAKTQASDALSPKAWMARLDRRDEMQGAP